MVLINSLTSYSLAAARGRPKEDHRGGSQQIVFALILPDQKLWLNTESTYTVFRPEASKHPPIFWQNAG